MTGIFRRGMRDRPKHDRKLCIRCKYHGTVGSREDKMYNVCCDYAALAHDGTCLKREHGEMIDRRGEDFESCKLFEEGKSLAKECETKCITIKRRGGASIKRPIA